MELQFYFLDAIELEKDEDGTESFTYPYPTKHTVKPSERNLPFILNENKRTGKKIYNKIYDKNLSIAIGKYA